MVLTDHSGAGLNNKSRSKSRVGAHIFLSENGSLPRWHGILMTIAQIMKYVVSSAAKAEMTAPFLTAKEMVPPRNNLQDIGRKQHSSQPQLDNSTAVTMKNQH